MVTSFAEAVDRRHVLVRVLRRLPASRGLDQLRMLLSAEYDDMRVGRVSPR